jgi:oxygen-independent coproporphyrinogen-3 oxidase
MAGIYIHIPFCKQACNYCDFHFSTQLNSVQQLVNSISKELELNKNYLSSHNIETIYFGGGTPSILSALQLDVIISSIYKNFNIDATIEFTLEANPDDLDLIKIKELKSLGINRLSIGIQSFLDDELKWMKRSHNAQQSRKAVENAQSSGFENISVDLIYGSKFQSISSWKKNIEEIIKLNVPHLSAYNLTIEEKTLLGKMNEKGIEPAIKDDFSKACFDLLMDEMNTANFVHYEISNFGKSGFFSKHNSNYWKGVHYLGIGPSAHSFDGTSRQWNIKNNAEYIRNIENNKIPFTKETLNITDQYNEYVLTGLRTMWGVNINHLSKKFGNLLEKHFKSEIEVYLKKGFVNLKNDDYILTQQGKHLADKISSDLFYID